MKRRKFRIRHIILAAAVFFMMYTLIEQQLTIVRKKAEISKYNQEYKKLQSENEDMKDKIEYSKTDEYKEEMAREMMGLIKQGETVYILDEGAKK